MADYVRTEKTTREIRYELPSPTNHSEYAKARAAAARSFEELIGRPPTYDDDLKITAEDELVVIWFRVPA